MFVREVVMGAGSSYTENGAISYGSFGSNLMNQFGKAGVYRGRSMGDVFAEQSALWAEDAESALRFPFYLRMITRKDKAMGGNETDTVQRGQGNRDEAFKRLIWIALYHPEVFYKNLWVLPIVGSWKDLWVMLTMCDGLKKEEFFKVMAEGINDDYHRELVKKYLPRIRSNSKCKTEWAKKTNELAKEFAAFAGWTPKEYRLFKSTGKAHEFQRYICSGLYSRLNFNAIPGKALLNIVSGKFLKNHNLENDYLNWIKAQPVAKFNGYAFELGRKLGNHTYGYNAPSLVTKVTVDKQFDGLIATASKDGGALQGNVLCALDTSGSMNSPALDNAGTTPFHVCVSLGIYLSELNTGAFHNTVAMFDDTSKLLKLKGKTFSDKWNEILSQNTAWGSTNFQSVIDLLVRTRTFHPEIDLADFPSTIVVVSDMQFNPAEGWHSIPVATNYEMAMAKLTESAEK